MSIKLKIDIWWGNPRLVLSLTLQAGGRGREISRNLENNAEGNRLQ